MGKAMRHKEEKMQGVSGKAQPEPDTQGSLESIYFPLELSEGRSAGIWGSCTISSWLHG